jgi:hypothetical protein
MDHLPYGDVLVARDSRTKETAQCDGGVERPEQQTQLKSRLSTTPRAYKNSYRQITEPIKRERVSDESMSERPIARPGGSSRTASRVPVDRLMFDRIKKRHAAYASWAVWAKATAGPKSNVGDLTVLDPDRNPALLPTLRNDVVMLGLNLSRGFPVAFGNFHDATSRGQDYKIRFAFAGTPYYGAYMTDLIKGVVMLKSGDLVRYLSANQGVVAKNIDSLVEEFDDLNALRPTLIAFGADAYAIAAKHVPPSRYSRLVRVTHYSHYISKEAYRERVFAELSSIRDSGSGLSTPQVAGQGPGSRRQKWNKGP